MPVLGSKTPMLACPLPVQSPTTGRSPESPKVFAHSATEQLSRLSALLMVRFCCCVGGSRRSSLAATLSPVHTSTGKGFPCCPSERHPPIVQSSSTPLLLTSRNQWPVLGRNM